MAAITSPDYPGERLIVCRNPDLARERARKREDLLGATERDLAKVARAVTRERKPLRSRGDRARGRGGAEPSQGGQALRANNHGRCVPLQPQHGRDRGRGGARRLLRGAHEPARDDARRCRDGAGLQVARPGGARVPEPQGRRPAHPARLPLAGAAGARARVFVHARLSCRVAHAPQARADALRGRRSRAAAALRASIVAPAQRSPAALRKQTRGITADGLPVHSFRSLLADLATYRAEHRRHRAQHKYAFMLHTRPTAIQQKAFDLLAVNPARTQ